MIRVPFGSAELTDWERQQLQDQVARMRADGCQARLTKLARTDLGVLTGTIDVQVPVPLDNIELHLEV